MDPKVIKWRRKLNHIIDLRWSNGRNVCWFIVKSWMFKTITTHQLVDSFILEELGEGAGHRWHREPCFLLSELRDLLQTAAEMIVRLAGHVHVTQREVQPEGTGRKTRFLSLSYNTSQDRAPVSPVHTGVHTAAGCLTQVNSLIWFVQKVFHFLQTRKLVSRMFHSKNCDYKWIRSTILKRIQDVLLQ